MLLVLQNSPNMAISYHSQNLMLPHTHPPGGKFPWDVLEEETALKEIFQAHQSRQEGVCGGSNRELLAGVLNELSHILC